MFSCYVLDSSRFPGQGYSLQSASHKSSVFSYKIWTQSVQQVPGFSSVSYGILAQALSFLFHLLLHKAKGFSLQLASNRSSIKIWTQSVQQVPGSGSFSFGILAQALSFLFHLLLHKAKGF